MESAAALYEPVFTKSPSVDPDVFEKVNIYLQNTRLSDIVRAYTGANGRIFAATKGTADTAARFFEENYCRAAEIML